MKEFPNMVFESGSIDSIYFFNTAMAGYSDSFFTKLIKALMPFGSLILHEPYLNNDYINAILANEDFASEKFVLESKEKILNWINQTVHHPTIQLITTEKMSLQIYSDPHNWDVCIIGTSGAISQRVEEILKDIGYWDIRMTKIEVFSELWQKFASPILYDYAMEVLRTEYAPFLH